MDPRHSSRPSWVGEGIAVCDWINTLHTNESMKTFSKDGRSWRALKLIPITQSWTKDGSGILNPCYSNPFKSDKRSSKLVHSHEWWFFLNPTRIWVAELSHFWARVWLLRLNPSGCHGRHPKSPSFERSLRWDTVTMLKNRDFLTSKIGYIYNIYIYIYICRIYIYII